MTWTTPDLSDDHGDALRVLAPILRGFGGREAFSGEVITLACFEDNSFVKSLAEEPGRDRVLVVDGGASVRRALLGDQIAQRFVDNGWRSEEHTSELQTLMRISYAVFCLKKKKITRLKLLIS